MLSLSLMQKYDSSRESKNYTHDQMVEFEGEYAFENDIEVEDSTIDENGTSDSVKVDCSEQGK